MASTLKVKLFSATTASVVAIGILGLNAYFCSGILANKLVQTHLVAVGLRNHTLADMMHDALRADVFSALYAATKSPERKQQIAIATREHAAAFKNFISMNKELALPAELKTALAHVEESLQTYVSSAEDLVATAFENERRAEVQLVDFEKQFSVLEVALDAEGDKFEAYAKTESDSAKAFAAQAKELSQLGLLLGLLISAFTVWVMRRDVLAPLTAMTGAMHRLANGNVDAILAEQTLFANDGNGELGELGDMARSVEVFRKNAVTRNKLTRESRVLSELNEWLQSAKSELELYQMIATFLSRLLPDCIGSLYIYANSRDILECVQVWNGTQGTDTMHPDDCWGLRRGRTYTHGQHEIEFECSHVHTGAGDDYCCIPILAHGETVGLLHLEFAPKDKSSITCSKTAFTEERRLGLASAEHISLAIANVKLREQLRDQSIRDVLTGLFNRRYLLETCRREFQRAARAGQSVSVLSIDVDHFKTFNDNHGHDAGDAVLRCVGEALRTTFRDEDVPCRFGGEEFVVLLPGALPSVAEKRAEEIRVKIEALTVRYAEGNLPKVTISIGVASFPESGAAPMEVLKVADEALYVAKREGRNCVRVSAGCRRTSQTIEGNGNAISPDEGGTASCCGEQSARDGQFLEAAE